jgi:hypothetical protein
MAADLHFAIRATHELPVWNNRRAFLEAVRHADAKVLQELKTVIPLMQEHDQRESEFEAEADADGGEPVPSSEEPRTKIPPIEITSEDLVKIPPPLSLQAWRHLQVSVDFLFPESEPLLEAIHAWSVKYNLTNEWILDITVFTLFVWANVPQTIEQPTWHFPRIEMVSPLLHPEKQFCVADAWDAPFEPWEAFDSRVQESFRKARSEYKKRIEGLLRSRGWHQPSVRQLEHFRWLALYQVKRMSAKRILQELSLNLENGENTVSKGITKAASLIGLTLRQPKYSTTRRKK